MAGFIATPEQENFFSLFDSPDHRVSKGMALAGTGKSTTFIQNAIRRPDRDFACVTFNRAIADEMGANAPRNMKVGNIHRFAFRAVGSQYHDRLNSGASSLTDYIDIFHIEGFKYGDAELSKWNVASMVKEAIRRFAKSADNEISGRHIPKVPALTSPEGRRALKDTMIPLVNRAWREMVSENGRLRMVHDVYLHLWGMGDPILPGNAIYFDEAQDATEIARHIVERQLDRGATLDVVGDSNQQLYAWAGATDALDHFDVPEEFVWSLTKSFRFGPAVAEVANLILDMMDAKLRLVGHDPIDSKIAVLTDPETVLCRTNAGAMDRLMQAQLAGKKAGMIGGTDEVEALAKAAVELASGRQSNHSEFRGFKTWADVQEYVESDDPDASNLKVLVKLVDRYGANRILEAVQASVPVESAEFKVSTGHKAKGLEWDRVQINSDFFGLYQEDEESGTRRLNLPEAQLLYVAATRGKLYLDPTSVGELQVHAVQVNGKPFEVMAAEEVPERIVVLNQEAGCQIICDPNDASKVLMVNTKFHPDLLAAQRKLPRRSYRAEYEGYAKVNLVLATSQVLELARQWGLQVSGPARERINSMMG